MNIEGKKKVIVINSLLVAALFGLVSLNKEILRPALSNTTIANILTACKQEVRIKKIDVSEHGIVANTKQSITAKINELIESLNDEPVIITFPKGRYDFYPDSNYFRPYFETNSLTDER